MALSEGKFFFIVILCALFSILQLFALQVRVSALLKEKQWVFTWMNDLATVPFYFWSFALFLLLTARGN